MLYAGSPGADSGGGVGNCAHRALLERGVGGESS